MKRERRERPRQRHARELLAHAAREHPLIERLQWPAPRRRRRGCTLEHVLDHAIVMAIEPARHRSPPPSHGSTVLDVILGGRARDDGQAGIGPEMPLRAKPPRRLPCREQQCHADWASERNRAQHPPRGITPGLGEHRRFRRRPQRLQHLAFGGERGRATPHAPLAQLREPGGSLLGVVHGPTRGQVQRV